MASTADEEKDPAPPSLTTSTSLRFTKGLNVMDLTAFTLCNTINCRLLCSIWTLATILGALFKARP